MKITNSLASILLSAIIALASTPLYAEVAEPSIIVDSKLHSEASNNLSTNAKTAEDEKSYQQLDYEMALQHAVVSYGLLKDFWPLKFPKQALKENKPFDKSASDILSTHTQTLLSINAPLYEEEIPELYALWKDAFDLMDEAEAKKLYTPPENLRSLLTAWRAKKAIASEVDAAPWVNGPATVSIDANLAPISIPTGFRFLPADEHTKLNERIVAVKNAAITKEKIKMPLFVDDKRIVTNWLMPIDNQNWSADIVVISHGHTAIDEALPHREGMIYQIRSRLNPVSNLKIEDAGNFSEKAVRWLISPEADKKNATIRWAFTNGNVSTPLGITFAHMKLGATQQVLVSFSNLRTAECFVTAEYLPEGKTHDEFKAENRLKQITTSLAPLFDSLQFAAGKRLEDAKDSDLQNPTPLEYLIIGAPSIMETGVKRMVEEQKRKENFWLFLQDHPRYQGALLGALVFLLFGIKAAVENWMQQDGVWTKVLKRSLGMLSISALIVGGFLILLNMTFK